MHKCKSLPIYGLLAIMMTFTVANCTHAEQKIESLFHQDKFINQWKIDFVDSTIKGYVRGNVNLNKTPNGKLLVKIDTENSDLCMGDLIEESVEAEGYLVVFSAATDSQCPNNRVQRGYLMPYSWDSQWPYLALYGNEGQVAYGTLGGLPTRLTDLDNALVSNAEKQQKEIEKQLAILSLKAIEPQILYTQCRLHQLTTGREDDPKWCLCFEQNFQKVLSPAEYQAAVDDYNSFNKKAFTYPDNPKDDWRYANVRNKCSKCHEDFYHGCLEKETTPNQNSYHQILTAFLNGKASTIKKDMVYKHFYVDYVQSYSDVCGDFIDSGVERTTTEREYDRDGFEVGIPTVRTITIESGYIEKFDNYLNDVKGELMKNSLNLLTDMMTNRNESMNNLLSNFIFSRRVLYNHLNQGCMSDEVQGVYEQLREK